MAQNIWDATLDVDNNVKQNSFDWNHTNNLTTQIGRLTPVFCDLVPAKTSFRVKPSFGLQFMPMVFPIQTRMRASISFFRYPLRALWKDYKDFVGNFRQGLEEPYINLNTETRIKKMSSTGSLGDYLGIPTTMVGSFGAYNQVSSISNCAKINLQTTSALSFADLLAGSSLVRTCPTDTKFPRAVYGFTYTLSKEFSDIGTYSFRAFVSVPSDYSSPVGILQSTVGLFLDNEGNISADYIDEEPVVTKSGSYMGTDIYEITYNVQADNATPIVSFFMAFDYSSLYNYMDENTSINPTPKFDMFPLIRNSITGVYSGTRPKNNDVISDINLNTSPYYNSNSANRDYQIKLSAYAFRAYEGIYNAFYRDNRNNPYYINGEVQYNQWIPSYEGGEDNNLYELRYANWERDFLTTSVQSPQQGQAPLVGITTYTTTGVMTNADGTSSEIPVQKVALVDESGKRYSVEFQSNDEGLTGVNYVELENGVTVRSARNLLDLATSGISIPDLRMVNCYQKFLELNMRKGYSYKEIVEGRFDVNVKYADLLLPQFFGGFSRDMNMNAITQTVDQDSTGSGNYREALGSQAGVGYFSGNTGHNIECFCDEESIIMGILVVTPLPVYTQLLPKHFTYRGLLDHFNPEFNNIGFQPISYKEVCPIQAYNDTPSSLGGTFGYQRPWYEYCQRYDQAHGLFRTSLSNFLMHRVFNVKPELAQSFLVIDPEQVTDVFSVTETTDKIYGQIRFDITCQLPVARVAIPRLD
ncbi:MAG: major capsid protein [Microviridae sp.]|nr:MAG: major capsid protein [Microviridae sp.]